jgi:amino acid permease
MKLKFKAAAIVVGFFALAIAVQGVLVLAVETYGAQAVLNTFVGCVLLFMIYQMYTLILQRLESDKKIQDLVDRK